MIIRLIKKFQSYEFSKRLAKVSRATTLTLTVLAIVFPMLGLNIDGISTALPYAWGSTAAVEVFYLWKAKNENRRKYAMQFVDKYADKYGIDAAIAISNVVLKD